MHLLFASLVLLGLSVAAPSHAQPLAPPGAPVSADTSLEPDITVMVSDRSVTVTGLFPEGPRIFRGPSIPILDALARQSWGKLTEIVTGFTLSGDLRSDFSNSKSTLVLKEEIRKQMLFDLARQGALIYDELFNRDFELAGAMQRLNQDKDSVGKRVYIYSESVLLPWSVIYASDSRLLEKLADVQELRFWGYRYRLAAFMYNTLPRYWPRPLVPNATRVLFGHYKSPADDELTPEVVKQAQFFKDHAQAFTPTDSVSTGDTFIQKLSAPGPYDFVYVFAHGTGGIQPVKPIVLPPVDGAPTAAPAMPIDARVNPLDVGMWFSTSSFLTPRDIRNMNLSGSVVGPAVDKAVKRTVVMLNICEGAALGQTPDATFPSAFFDVGAGAVITPSVKVWAGFARDYFTEFASRMSRAAKPSDLSELMYQMNREYQKRGLPFSLFYALYGNGAIGPQSLDAAPTVTPTPPKP